MRHMLLLTVLLAGAAPAALHAQGAAQGKKRMIHDFQVVTIDGKKIDLARYKGKVLVIVNVASECGYTGQYKPLQALHARYAKEGLAILAFPCNDFGAQEPDDEAKIKRFAQKTYGVEFDLFSKIRILGKDSSTLYRFLTSKESNPNHAGEVKWNFEKFIIGRDGTIVARFAAETEPDSEEFMDALRKALGRK